MEEQKKSEGTMNQSEKNKESAASSTESTEKHGKEEDVQKKIVDEEVVSSDKDAGERQEEKKKAENESKNQPEEKEEEQESEEDDEKVRAIRNLVSLVIILAGFAIGSLFIDVAQFVSGSGFSQKAIRDASVIVAGEKTWVAFEEPIVDVNIVTVSEDEMDSCPECDPTEVVDWLKRFLPTMEDRVVDASSPEGQAMIERFGLKTIPSYVFSSDIEDTGFYQGEASVLFEEKEGNYVLNSTELGIPVGKYLETPSIDGTDAVLGNKEAPVKIFVYSDFQCPFCSKYYEEVKGIASEYGKDKVVLIYKDLPLDFHAQAMNAANAARCAQDQNMFWEMADLLYGNQETWGETEGTTAFKTLASQIGLDSVQFSTCIEEATFSDLINKDVAEAENFGISGTPASFVNDQFVSGVISSEELKKMVDEQLSEAGASSETEIEVEIE